MAGKISSSCDERISLIRWAVSALEFCFRNASDFFDGKNTDCESAAETRVGEHMKLCEASDPDKGLLISLTGAYYKVSIAGLELERKANAFYLRGASSAPCVRLYYPAGREPHKQRLRIILKSQVGDSRSVVVGYWIPQTCSPARGMRAALVGRLRRDRRSKIQVKL
jgi:hypothetical protein